MPFDAYDERDMTVLSHELAGALAGIQKVEGTFTAARLEFATRTLTPMLLAHYDKGERDFVTLQNSAIAEFLLDYTMRPEVPTLSQNIYHSGAREGTSASCARRPLFGT